jgi:hypothetical protein
MAYAGERDEITAHANAKETETVREAQKLSAKAKQVSASNDERLLVRSAKARKGRSRKRKP